MNVVIFNKKYWVRRFGPQEEVRGYITTQHEDFVVSLNVHPGSMQEQAESEGERRINRLEAHGTDLLRPANHDREQKGDLLWYHGEWYECISAVEWDHTILNHWNYSFVMVPGDAHGTIDLSEPPTMDPDEYGKARPPIAGPEEAGFFRIKPGSGLYVDCCGNLRLTEEKKAEIRERRGDVP